MYDLLNSIAFPRRDKLKDGKDKNRYECPSNPYDLSSQIGPDQLPHKRFDQRPFPDDPYSLV